MDNLASLTYDVAMSESATPGRKPERLIRTDTPLPQTIIIGAYLLLVVALPLLFSPDVMHPFGSPKLTALAIAAAGTWAVAIAWGYSALHLTRLQALLVGILIILATLSLAGSPTLGVSFWGTAYDEVGYFAVLLSVSVLLTGTALTPILEESPRLRWYLVAPLPILLLVAGLHLAGVPLPHLLAGGGRVRASLGNPIHYGAYCAAVAWLSAELAFANTGRGRFLWTLAALGGLAGLAVSGTRGAVLGLVIAGLVRLVVRPPKAISRNRRLTAVLLLMAVLIGSFLFYAVSTSEAAWLAPLRHLTELAPDTYGMRAQAWEAGAASILDKPFLGTGPETFRRTYLEHLASQPPVNLAGTKLDILGDAHNWVIEFASTYGLPFIFALFALIVLPIRTALHGDALRRGALLASITLWATYLTSPFSLSTLPLAFLTLGIASSTTNGGPHNRPRPNTLRTPAAVIPIAVITVAAILFSAGSFLYVEWQARQDYIRGDANGTFAAGTFLMPERPAPFIAAGEAAAFNARYLEDPGAAELSDKSFTRAVSLDPANPFTYMYWGESLQLQNRHEEAIARFQAALELVPAWPPPAQAIARSQDILHDSASEDKP